MTKWALICAVLVGLCAIPTSGRAAFPGDNGMIAYSQRGGISLLNPYDRSSQAVTGNRELFEPSWSADGTRLVARSGDVSIGSPTWIVLVDLAGNVGFVPNTLGGRSPSWSPDGTRIAFVVSDDATVPGDVFTIAPDGTGKAQVTSTGDSTGVAWSPDGTRLAWSREPGGMWTIAPAGADPVQLTTTPDFAPDWSPDGTRLAFESTRDDPQGGSDVYVMNADGSEQTRLTFDGDFQNESAAPAWSPDGTRIAFHSNRARQPPFFECGPRCYHDIWAIRPDGSGLNNLGGSGTTDEDPSWQPVQLSPGNYARPMGATPMHVSLVPAFRECGAPDRTHGPPLAFGSCSGPALASEWLTVGTPDANGRPARSVGHARMAVAVGDPGTSADEADVHVQVRFSDVLERGTLADYAGELELAADVRLTDRLSGATDEGGEFAATVVDQPDYGIPLRFAVPCVSTPNPQTGGSCAVDTTFDAVLPGVVHEKGRSIWQLGQMRVRDGGEDGAAASDGNTLFAVQGVFAP